MNKLLAASAIIFCLLFNNPATHAQSLPTPILKAFNKAQLPTESIGVYVQELAPLTQNKKPLISWQADRAMQPGSSMKLVTSYAALDMLGPAYTWKTSVYMTGRMDGEVLKGDLIIQGGADPQLVVENFWMLIHQIRSKGIREIQGNLILDVSWMAPQQFDAADFDGDPTRPYNVGPYALLVNYNVLNLQLQIGSNGLKVTNLTPLALQTQVDVQLISGACDDWRHQLTPKFSMAGHTLHMVLTGSYPISCGDQHWAIQPYPLPYADYVGALFRALWKEVGGQFDGEVKQGALSASADLVTELRSKPLSEILLGVNKYSNNVMSRLVMLTLDREANQQAADPVRAARIINDWLPDIGINPQGFVIDNGSGLSRTARISPYQMGRMLEHAFASRLMPEFMSSMPIMGIDGSMKKRGKKQAVVGHAHIKTGRLNNARAIAGYVLAASGKRYVVVCFVNHDNADSSVAAQDELLQWVYANG